MLINLHLRLYLVDTKPQTHQRAFKCHVKQNSMCNFLLIIISVCGLPVNWPRNERSPSFTFFFTSFKKVCATTQSCSQVLASPSLHFFFKQMAKYAVFLG